MKKSSLVVGVVGLLAALLTAVPIQSSAQTLTIQSIGDAYVQKGQASTNFGTSTALKVRDISPALHSYVQFEVSGVQVGESIARATLRLYSSGTSGDACSSVGAGVDVFEAASNSWSEGSITFTNAPGKTGSRLSSADNFGSGLYVDFDVTAAVHGNGKASLFLEMPPCTTDTAATAFRSKEATSNRPQLVVTTESAPQTSQCSDGIDNDGDGATDYPDDPGCSGAQDDSEADAPEPSRTVAAVGDIVCDPTNAYFNGATASKCQHRKTLTLVTGADAILTLGDLQYETATRTKFDQAYDPTWGAVADKTFPSPGNHEYRDPNGGAAGYFGYWGSKGRPTGGANGYYSWDISPTWHLIALNSSDGTCQSGPACAEGSAQNTWLEEDLAQVPSSDCILAYWHHPLFNSGANNGGENTSAVKAFWTDLYVAGADLILNGHEHNYQRYSQ